MQYMLFLAQEVREIMAELGFRRFDDLVGHVDVLEFNPALKHFKAKGLDFSRILYMPAVNKKSILRSKEAAKFDTDAVLDSTFIHQVLQSLAKKQSVKLSMPVKNYHRTVGAMLSARIAGEYGSGGIADDMVSIKFDGSAGQSFGAFLINGVTFELSGDANDYLGKGLSGGKIIVYPPSGSTFLSHKNIISGNVNLFGATAGEVYLSGLAGERFCVRNSGAIAVVEGVGDHGCEYMTGGRVIVLGPTGVNFAAGMSGGIAYVLDENQLFDTRCNLEMVDIEQVRAEQDEEFIKRYIRNHANYTGSRIALHILESWEDILPYFVKVMPIDYKKALNRIQEKFSKESDSVGMTEEVY
jgi:glutamate synthase domain-containing protein 3